MSDGAPRSGEISGSRAFIIILIFVFSFLATRTAHTREPISTHDSSKDVAWREKVPLSKCFSKFWLFGRHFLRKPHKFGRQYGNPSQNEKVE